MTQMTSRPVLLIRGSGNERDAKALSALGIPTVSESFIQITPGEKDVALQLLKLASEIDGWVIVTSRNGLNCWNTLVEPNSLAHVFSNNPKLKFAAVGTGSADALRSVGVPEVLVPVQESSEGLLSLLSTYPASTAIMPAGNLARNILSEGLRSKGWMVHTGVVYVNSPTALVPTAVSGIGQSEFSAVVLRSPSAARALAHFLPTSSLPVICGDASTAATARELTLNVVAVANNPSPESIATLAARTLEE